MPPNSAKEEGYKFEFEAKDTGKKVAIIGGTFTIYVPIRLH
jgi:hypothetical protein